MVAETLAQFLARRMFEIGGDPGRDARRIEFKDAEEVGLGGFTKGPFTDFLQREIERYGSSQETRSAPLNHPPVRKCVHGTILGEGYECVHCLRQG